MHLTAVDAFTDHPCSGNPAAVAFVPVFPPDERMQSIAREMNLSETAFVAPRAGGGHDLRWFTPSTEVDLCGHATLAAAHLLGGTATFHTRSGVLACRGRDGWVEMDLPTWHPQERPLPRLPTGLATPRWTGTAGDDWLVELPDPGDVTDYQPDLAGIAALGRRAFIITALAENCSSGDVVSRVFAPNAGIPEDPATRSAHCALAPYWCARLGRDELLGIQASARGGTIRMRLAGDRVVIGGRAVTISEVRLLV